MQQQAVAVVYCIVCARPTVAAAAPKAKAVLEARIKALEGKVAAHEQGGTATGAAAGDAILAGDADTGDALAHGHQFMVINAQYYSSSALVLLL
jgi:O-acetylhomoserine/O-acetylserine sulfhydrylase-like pyridoxal-dependent enzyme